MSIQVLNKSLPGVTMRYEDGGRVQVYKVGELEIRFPPDATPEEIIAAFKEQK